MIFLGKGLWSVAVLCLFYRATPLAAGLPRSSKNEGPRSLM